MLLCVRFVATVLDGWRHKYLFGIKSIGLRFVIKVTFSDCESYASKSNVTQKIIIWVHGGLLLSILLLLLLRRLLLLLIIIIITVIMRPFLTIILSETLAATTQKQWRLMHFMDYHNYIICKCFNSLEIVRLMSPVQFLN